VIINILTFYSCTEFSLRKHDSFHLRQGKASSSWHFPLPICYKAASDNHTQSCYKHHLAMQLKVSVRAALLSPSKVKVFVAVL